MATIAFIGLGNMGNPMAANLVKAGHAVQGFDLVPDNLKIAKGNGVVVMANAASAIKNAEVVITMLPAGKHVISVYEDVAPKVDKGTLVIDSSTIDVELARKAHAIAAKHGLASIDAPVSGGTGGAAAGTLTFMAGGAPEAFARGRTDPEAHGRAHRPLRRCGRRPSGQDLQQHDTRRVDDRCRRGVRSGREAGALASGAVRRASTSSGQCWSLTSYCPVPGPVPNSPANCDYKPGFAAALMLKDLKLAQEAAQGVGAATPLGAEAAQLYALFNAQGGAGTDFSGIINFIRGNAA